MLNPSATLARDSQKNHSAATLACFLLFAFLSFLWCRRFFSFEDLGSQVMMDGDPALNAWALNWVSRAFSTDLGSLFNGNTFYPYARSIALSEHMAALAIFNVPVRWFTDNPWVGYNLIIFGAYLLSAIGAYLLLYELTQSRLAACWAGIFWAFCFFRVHHLSHLQILTYQWFPFIALFILRLDKNPSLKNACLLSLFFILQALTSWYLAVIASFLALIIFVANLKPTQLTIRHFGSFALAGILVAIAIAPFAWPYIGAIRDTDLSGRLAAASTLGDQVKLLDFFFPPVSTYLGTLIPNNKYWVWQENTLFIGYSACLLALPGLWYSWQKNRRLALTALALILIGYVLALGYFSTALGGKLPLYYIAQKFSFIAAIRAPQRFALLIYFGVLLLSGYGIAYLASKFNARLSSVATALFALLFLFEVYPTNLPYGQPVVYRPSILDSEIAKLSKNKNESLVVLHYPIYTAMPGYPTNEAVYMVDSTIHWAKIMNGFSGAEPLGFKDNMKVLNTLPSPEALALLKKNDVNILAIHAALPEARRLELKAFFEAQPYATIRQVGADQFLVLLDHQR
jgi:hypothetical protein